MEAILVPAVTIPVTVPVTGTEQTNSVTPVKTESCELKNVNGNVQMNQEYKIPHYTLFVLMT